MFGKKKDKPIHAMHYDGLKGFSQDYPCTLDFQEDLLVIKKLKPEMTVTLPINRIEVCEVMEEKNYMVKYHNQNTNTSKFGNKYYLVIKYDEGVLTFWSTAQEYSSFMMLKNKFQAHESYSL